MNIYEELKKIFDLNKNKHEAIKMSKYMKYNFDFYGIPSPKRKKITKEIIKDLKKEEIINWNLIYKCYDDNYREFQYFANDYLSSMKKYLAFEDIDKLLFLAKKKQWWDTIDFLDKIIGDIGLIDIRVNELMIKLSMDNDFWIRRIAIDHQNSRKEKTNKELLEVIIKNNFGSNEFFINKAIGWSLRNYSKVNPNWVKHFIYENKDKMNKLSIKEASKYL